jgi:hypothetical protein
MISSTFATLKTKINISVIQVLNLKPTQRRFSSGISFILDVGVGLMVVSPRLGRQTLICESGVQHAKVRL